MRKALMVVLTASVLVLMFVPSVFADDSGYFSVKDVYVKDSATNAWVDNSGRYTWSIGSDYGFLLSWKPESVVNQIGLKFTLVPAGYVMVQSGYYYNFNFTFEAKVPPSSSLANDHTFSLTFDLSDGTTKTIYPYSSSLTSNSDDSRYTWESAFSLYVGDGTPVRVTGITFETDYPGDTSGSYRVYVYSSVTTEPTPELKRHLEILEKLQEIYSGLSDEIQQQTEDILGEDYGFEQPSSKGDTDQSVSDLADQLANMSEQINQSVSDFQTSIDGLKEHINNGKVFIWGWLDYVPMWFTGICTGFAGLLIARKIVK